MTTDTLNRMERNDPLSIVRATAPATGLALASLVSYELTTRILSSAMSSRDDQMLGGMWSVVATLFVCHASYRQSISAALSRTVATLLSFVLCLGYLLLFPFSSLGMAILIGRTGAVVLILIDRPEDVITNTITTTVVMVVAGISPQHAWTQPILRLGDTLIGLAVGIVAVLVLQQLRDKTPFGEITSRT